ncbi:MAG: hypothetical protein NT062_34650 [Proteobacteria bacterium]|nr:hypothetical protein [Pseudomonadota bacterium]
MKQRYARSSTVVVLILVGLGLAWSGDAHAQAWVGDKGSLDLNLDYNLGVSKKVIGDSTLSFNDTGTTTHQLTLAAEYVPIPKLAVNVALPFVALKYTGNKTMFPHPGGGSYDSGGTFTTLTDLRAGARYQVLEEPFALSPHIGVSVPVANYEYIGNSVAGRHLKALHLGLGLGRQLGDATYLHLLYEFSLVEKFDRTPETAKHSQNRSDAAFTIGHKLLDYRLDLHLDVNMRVTHGGVNFTDFATLSQNELLYHDVILAEDIVLAGGGLGYQISNSLSMTMAARFFVTGMNTQNASVFALGVSWSPL